MTGIGWVHLRADRGRLGLRLRYAGAMKLLPPELAAGLPAIGSDPVTPMRDTRILMRFYDSESSWEWLVLESDRVNTCFGLILSGSTAVAGQFQLTELEALTGSDGRMSVLRDQEFVPLTIGELARHSRAVAEFLRAPNPRELRTSAGLIELE